MCRLLIVDDHPLFRKGVRAALEDAGDFAAISDVGTGREAIEALEGGGFDLVVVDLGLPDLSGFDILDAFANRPEGPVFFVLSMNADKGSVRKALALGAAGYASKNMALEKLVLALRVVLMGELFVEGELLRDILTLEAAAPADRAELLERLAALTDRERQTLDALLDGFNGKEIAARLSVSLRTVENYQSSIYGKLRARTAVDLVRIAGRAGLVSGL